VTDGTPGETAIFSPLTKYVTWGVPTACRAGRSAWTVVTISSKRLQESCMSEPTPALVRYGSPPGRWALLATCSVPEWSVHRHHRRNVACNGSDHPTCHASASDIQWNGGVNGYT